MIKSENKRIMITIPKEIYYKIKKDAERENRSISNYILNKLDTKMQ